MTCRMAAGQQKKRFTSSNIHEQFKGKKKRQDSSDCILNLRSHVDLEWDDIQRRVVAKKEQVGLSWTDITPFLDIVCLSHTSLADIITVPHEIFILGNLVDVLFYEVWATCLSESERKLLTQFLPSGKGAEQAVHSLLKGENHYFGNPFLKCEGYTKNEQGSLAISTEEINDLTILKRELGSDVDVDDTNKYRSYIKVARHSISWSRI